LVTELHEVLREGAGDEAQYKRYVSSLKNSILTAFYTPTEVINVLVETLHKRGIAPMRLLDPSAGTGAFASAFRQQFPDCENTCFEKDLLTGKILAQLYLHDKVRTEGFENIESRYTNHYDIATSNIPFGDVAVYDPSFATHNDPARRMAARSVHNYFFLKSVDMVRDGGIVAFITSQGVLNAEKNRPVRQWLMEHCEPVSVVRLPNNLFTDHAGTEVGSDLVILQRKARETNLTPRQLDFIESRRLSNGIQVNNLFQTFDRVVHTSSKVDTDPYGKPALVFLHDGGVSGIAAGLKDMLHEDFAQHLDVERYLLHSPQRLEQPKYIVSQPVQTSEASPKMTKVPAPETSSPRPSVSSNEFTGSLFGNEEISKATVRTPTSEVSGKETPLSVSREPLISLYDLFGLPETERSHVKKPRTRSKEAKPVEQTSLEWRELLQIRNAASPPETVAEKEARIKQEEKKEEERQEHNKPVPFTAERLKHYREGSLVSGRENRIGYLRGIDSLQPMFHPLELARSQRQRASLYIEIRNTYHHLYVNEAERLLVNPALRDMLNRLYDDFTKQFGQLNDVKNLGLIKMDAGWREILSLERYTDGHAVKADIFNRPVAFNPDEITHVENACEALAASLNKYAGVNLDYMASLTGNKQDQILEELKGAVYFNPLAGGYEMVDKFIAGNVIDKAGQVESFLESNPGHEAARVSLEALRETA